MIKTKNNVKIVTKNKDSKVNGSLLTIFNINEGFVKPPPQIYITTVLPNETKGPHLHQKRAGFFTCIKGDVKIVLKIDGKYEEYCSGESHNHLSVIVPADVECAIVNIGTVEAYVLNAPSRPYDPKDNYTPIWDDYKGI